MRERVGSSEPIQPEGKSGKGNDKSKSITRRAFLAGATGVIGATIGVQSGAIKKAGELYENFENDLFLKKVEKEKEKVLADIQQGLDDQRQFEETLREHNDLIPQIRELPDTNSIEHKQIVATLDSLGWQLNSMHIRRGALSYGLFGEANQYAEMLSKNEDAIRMLAVLRVLYRKKVPYPEYMYWHNLAFAYLDLADVDFDTMLRKFDSLLGFVKNNEGLRVSRIPFENILYSMIDRDFDFDLNPREVQHVIVDRFPSWVDSQPTHVNKDHYGSFNDLSRLDIFDLNRLKDVIRQINNPEFVSSVFEERERDLQNFGSEGAGVIPRYSKSHSLYAVHPQGRNNRAVPLQSKVVIRSFASAARFHFHATQLEEPTQVHGPSSADQGFFVPQVVFSSVNESTMAVHFNISRMEQGQIKHDVIYLGEIKKVLK